MSDELPAWVYDLVMELQAQQDEHPKLFFTSGAFEGYRPYDWCPCESLKNVPPPVERCARAIAAYRAQTEADTP